MWQLRSKPWVYKWKFLQLPLSWGQKRHPIFKKVSGANGKALWVTMTNLKKRMCTKQLLWASFKADYLAKKFRFFYFKVRMLVIDQWSIIHKIHKKNSSRIWFMKNILTSTRKSNAKLVLHYFCICDASLHPCACFQEIPKNEQSKIPLQVSAIGLFM